MPILLNRGIVILNPRIISLGTMGPEGKPYEFVPNQGAFYFFRQNSDNDKNAIVLPRFDSVGVSNGLEWSLDGKTFYYNDSLTNRIQAFDFDPENGELENGRTVFDLKSLDNLKIPFPDGMTIDTRGHLWVAVFGSSQVNSKI